MESSGRHGILGEIDDDLRYYQHEYTWMICMTMHFDEGTCRSGKVCNQVVVALVASAAHLELIIRSDHRAQNNETDIWRYTVPMAKLTFR